MMSDRREDYTNLSLMLSRVMDDVGVNEECVLRRRRVNLVRENIDTFGLRMSQSNSTVHIFGSQTEGTTTDGLNSDTDVLSSMDDFNVIHDWKDWELGKINLLMIRDERRFPGYCKLQVFRLDAPLPLRRVFPPGDVDFVNDGDGNVLMKRFNFQASFIDVVRHGPAATPCTEGDIEHDIVPALKCNNWPKHYKQWAPNERRRDWPTAEMIHYMKSTGCFVVKAAHRLDDRDETWRISTSLAERCLMFSLNITQIRCYVLLKMIVKTFISPYLPDTISSYMCKTLVFHSIGNTRKEFWKEHNLLQCVHQVLLYMIAAVLDENCPNYFNKAANLFQGKIDGRNKVPILQRLRSVMRTKSDFLLEINFDQINYKLTTYIIDPHLISPKESNNCKRKLLCRQLLEQFYAPFCEQFVLNMDRISSAELFSLSNKMIKKGHIQSKAVRLFLPFMCSYYACIEASKAILHGTEPTPTCLKLFDVSLNSDVTSSRLKFASYLLCTGQLERTLSVLEDVEERMTDSVLMKCGCHMRRNPIYPLRFGEREASQQYPTTDSLAMCVIFSKAEIQCCPRELQYEMFFTYGERRNRVVDDWMDVVVMDALPYIYYLQYMTYRHLGRYVQQCTALNMLLSSITNNEYLSHQETAFNVLGQCLEYEGLSNLAFECYKYSTKIRTRNDAVIWHLTLLIFRLLKGS